MKKSLLKLAFATVLGSVALPALAGEVVEELEGAEPVVLQSVGSSVEKQEPVKEAGAGISDGAVIPLLGAVGDSISTYAAVHTTGLHEANGLVSTSPAGLIGLFFVKAGIVYYLDRQTGETRRTGLKITAGLWSGVTMNNLLLVAGASNPVSIVAGLLFGAYMFVREGEVLDRESRAAAN